VGEKNKDLPLPYGSRKVIFTFINQSLAYVFRSYAAGKWRRLSVPAVPPTLLQNFTELSIHRCSPGDIKEANNLAALRLLVEAFSCLDNDVISCWYDGCSLIEDKPICNRLSATHILALLQRVPRQPSKDWLLIVESHSSASLCTVSKSGNAERDVNEQGDVLLTSLWVLNRLWHLALTHGHLTFDNDHPELRFSFAKSIAREALAVCKLFPISNLELHGEGLVSAHAIVHYTTV
jgi:hypothetical protein